MPAAWQSFSANSETLGNPCVVAKPAGTVDGDLLVAHVFATNGIANAPTPPAGWTLEATEGSHRLYSKKAASEGASYTWANQTGAGCVVLIDRFNGQATSNPIESIQGASGSAGSVTLPSVTTGGGGRLLWASVITYNVTNTHTAPATTTKRYDAADSGARSQVTGGDETVGAGATGTRTWTNGNAASNPVGFMFAIASGGVVPASPATMKVVYNTANTFTVPPGVTSITVECEGAGAGGGTGAAITTGGGGGGGAYASSVLAVTPGNTHAVVVGAAGAAAGDGGLSSFGTGPLVRAAGGTKGGNADTLNNGAAGPGGTVANSIGTTRTAGSNGVAGGAGGAGAPPLGGAGGAANGGAGTAPGGGGGGGALLNGVGGVGSKGRVTVSWTIPDVVGKATSSSTKATMAAKVLNAVGEGLSTYTKAANINKTLDVVGEGLVSRVLALTKPLTVVGEGLSSGTKATAAAKTLDVVGEGFVSRQVSVVKTLAAVGEGFTSYVKAAAISKILNAVGEGFITETHPVQAYRTFTVPGEGQVVMLGPLGSKIEIPLIRVPTGSGPQDWSPNNGAKHIAGTVLFHEPPDQGDPVAGATVTLFRDSDGFRVGSTTTAADGTYTFPRDTNDPYTYHVEVRYTSGGVSQQGLSEGGCVPS